VVPHLGKALPLVDQDRPRQPSQDGRIGGDDLTLPGRLRSMIDSARRIAVAVLPTAFGPWMDKARRCG